MTQRNQIILYVGAAIFVMLLFMLAMDSSGTFTMIETILVLTIGIVGGYYISRGGVELGLR